MRPNAGRIFFLTTHYPLVNIEPLENLENIELENLTVGRCAFFSKKVVSLHFKIGK